MPIAAYRSNNRRIPVPYTALHSDDRPELLSAASVGCWEKVPRDQWGHPTHALFTRVVGVDRRCLQAISRRV